MTLNVIVLAAGEGKRMHSNTPKVLHSLAGRSLLAHVIATARELGADRIVVVHGHQGARVRAAFADQGDLVWVEQGELLGTGHAVQRAMPQVDPAADVLVLYGDVPLIGAASLRRLAQAASGGLAIMSAIAEDAEGNLCLLVSGGRESVRLHARRPLPPVFAKAA